MCNEYTMRRLQHSHALSEWLAPSTHMSPLISLNPLPVDSTFSPSTGSLTRQPFLFSAQDPKCEWVNCNKLKHIIKSNQKPTPEPTWDTLLSWMCAARVAHLLNWQIFKSSCCAVGKLVRAVAYSSQESKSSKIADCCNTFGSTCASRPANKLKINSLKCVLEYRLR